MELEMVCRDLKEPGVIDEKILYNAIIEQGPKGEEGRLFEEQGIVYEEITYLRLEFLRRAEEDDQLDDDHRNRRRSSKLEVFDCLPNHAILTDKRIKHKKDIKPIIETDDPIDLLQLHHHQ